MGGKWTTFRQIGEETVDQIIQENKAKLEPKYEKSMTHKFSYVGSYGRSYILYGIKQSNEELFSSYEDRLVFAYDIPRDCAKNLIHSYGTMALRVADCGV
jgi:glycerol-3-phosphate dehydrogenase